MVRCEDCKQFHRYCPKYADGGATKAWHHEAPDDLACRKECPGGFICGRPTGHTGEHEAHVAPGAAIARWEDRPTTTQRYE